jgi:H+/Cl- antiporter ClcA
MRGVALCESLLNRLRLPPFLRPALGGLIVGLLACISPQVLSSGHGALQISSVLERPSRGRGGKSEGAKKTPRIFVALAVLITSISVLELIVFGL